jgi:hypothetical protein
MHFVFLLAGALHLQLTRRAQGITVNWRFF